MARHGGEVTRDFSEIGALAVRISEQGAASLAREGNVRYVERDERRYALGLSSSQLTPSLSNGLYGLITTNSDDVHAGRRLDDATGADKLKQSYTGAGIKACVADTGLDYNHGDIAANYKGGIDTVANPDDFDPYYKNAGLADETHGTHVAGTVLAVDDRSTADADGSGVYGVAYRSELYHARVLTNEGGYSSDIMAGVEWLVKTAGCKLINMSLGGSFASKTEENFYKTMRNTHGALIVAAAGNDGGRKISYPAGYASNIAVGAVDRNNAHASFSNIGRNLDVSAPGVTVLSSVPANLGSEASVTTTTEYVAYGLEYAGKTDGTAGVTGPLVDCGRATAASDCVGEPTDATLWVALIERGDISFADKVKNAMDAGADSALIYNNVEGEFTGTLGAETTSDGRAWIPAVSTARADGLALKKQLGSSATVVNITSSWDHYDGTSMATPHATGVLALIWSANSMMTNSTVEDQLFKTVTDLGAAGYDTTYGYGLVNAYAAVKRAGG